MYLSRLTFPLLDRKAQRLLSDAYELHLAMMACLPSPAGRVLYRVEPEERHSRSPEATVLVQSDTEPDWNRLPTRHAVETKEALPQPAKGTRLRFRVRANPTVKKKREGQKNGTREGIIGETEQRAWLDRKGDAGGFAVDDCVVIDEGMVKARKKNGRIMSFRSVRFEGHMTVTDPSKFEEVLESGIGSGKAFGFGMVSVGRA